MIRRNEDYKREERYNMRGGKDKVIIEHLWEKDELCGRARLFARITLPPGSSIGFHDHVEEAEVFFIIKGKARMRDQNHETVLKAGDSILTSEAGHSVENEGNDPLEMLAVILPENKS